MYNIGCNWSSYVHFTLSLPIRGSYTIINHIFMFCRIPASSCDYLSFIHFQTVDFMSLSGGFGHSTLAVSVLFVTNN